MSVPIKRYVFDADGFIEEHPDGDWLKREDVMKLIAEKVDEAREFMLWDAVAALKSIEREL